MTWVRLDDQFAGHPKMEAVGPLAGWLHVAALCYCAQYLTDGRIPKTKALKLTDVPKPRAQIAKLLAEGVWDDDGDSYVIHDYLVYQPSRARVLAEREAAAERQRKARESRRDKPVTHNGSHAVSPPSPARPDPTPSHSRSDPLGFTEPDDQAEHLAAGVPIEPDLDPATPPPIPDANRSLGLTAIHDLKANRTRTEQP
jgi:hypothetical protein